MNYLFNVARMSLIIMLTLVVLDFIAYIATPRSIQLHFSKYHEPLSGPILGGRENYPMDYFVTHSERGFDIGPKKTGTHFVRDFGRYQVWSNSLGCFDLNELPMIATESIYLAGDSFTWGYVSYEDKFGTIMEKDAGLAILKCGVTHTGQAHQFSKFKEVAKLLEQYPKLVIVNYTNNDVANDYGYPHSTVIEGWLVDNVRLNQANERVEIDEQSLRNEVAARLARQVGLEDYALAYSLSYNVLNEIYRKGSSIALKKSKSTKLLRNIYELPAENGERYSFNTPFVQLNKEALTLWRAHARQKRYLLLVSLIPPREHVGKEYYRELEEFLRGAGIDFVNFSDHIARKSLVPEEIYWSYDRHLNKRGNQEYAEFLSLAIRDRVSKK